MSNNTSQFFLLLGEVDREGVGSKLKATGFPYQKKRLESGPENWHSILEILETPEIAGVVGKLTTHAYNVMCRPEYKELVERFLRGLQRVPHIMFVHQEILTGIIDTERRKKVEEGTYFSPDEFYPPDDEVRKHINDLLYSHNINIVPYVKNAEMITMALAFVDQNEKNLVFRLYVPVGKMWASEAERLLQLFRDYLGRVSGIKVRQDQYSTAKGTVYEFFSDHAVDPSSLPVEFDHFSTFLDLCSASPDKAVQMLQGKNISAPAVEEIVHRYAKEARRIHIDLKHERERKLLNIRQRMESELIDVVPTGADWQQLTSMVDHLVPQVSGVSSALGFNSQVSLAASTMNITVNHGPQVIGTVEGIVAQEVSGTQHLGAGATQLIELIEHVGGSRKDELISAVHELEDADAKNEDRLTAGQKLKAFLFKAGEKLGDVGTSVLTSYIENQLGL